MKESIKKRIEAVRHGEVPEGYRRTKDIGIAPSDWRVGQLSDVLHNKQRPVPKPDEPYWRLGVRSWAKGTFHAYVDDPAAVDMDELYVVQENDLVVNITFAWEHAIAVASKEDDGLLVSHRFPTYTFDGGNVPEYYKAVVSQQYFRDMLDHISPGGAGRNRVLNRKDFLALPCYIPPIAEQKKIAEILATCDRVIELKQQLLEEKRRQKQWLMQKLLDPNSGTRVPGFEQSEWNEVSLLDCCIKKGEYGLNAPACEYSPELPQYIRITDIDDNGKYMKDNPVSVNVSDAEDYYLHEGDLLFVRTGGTTGKVYRYEDGDGLLVYAGFLIRFSVDLKDYDDSFIYSQFSTMGYANWVKVMSMRSGQPGINAEEYGSFSFWVPKDKAEQSAIAAVLKCKDREIELLLKDLEYWQQKKKALMQLLLTGLVRVNA